MESAAVVYVYSKVQCTRPISIKYKGEIFEVPCGMCAACKISRVREWTVRIMHEMRYFKGSVFATLTYNDENLPINQSLEKTEFQKFMKRLRKELGDHKIKYFACGEYGEDSERPHYHAIILGLAYNENTQKLIESIWKKGFIKVGTVTKDSIRYTLDYMHKKYNGELGKELYEKTGREPPFQLVSQGMGKRHALESANQYAENLYMTFNGKKMSLPRYYKRLYGLDKETLKTAAAERARERVKILLDRAGGEVRRFNQVKSSSAHQRDLNIEARRQKRNKI